jgi:hypothetical protein
MDPEPTPSLPYETPKRQTPWGLFIGLLLILAIIVSGAYYALEKRIGTMPSAPQGQPY